MNLTDVLAERIKTAREAIPMTQKELSNVLGIRQQTLSGYETGRMKPTIDALVTIAEKCNVSIDWLCGLSENRQNHKDLRTGADVIDSLITLDHATCISISETIVDNYYHYAIVIHDTAFQRFLSDWKRMLELSHDLVIDTNLYNLWIKDQKRIFGNYEIGNEKSYELLINYFNDMDQIKEH